MRSLFSATRALAVSPALQARDVKVSTIDAATRCLKNVNRWTAQFFCACVLSVTRELAVSLAPHEWATIVSAMRVSSSKFHRKYKSQLAQ